MVTTRYFKSSILALSFVFCLYAGLVHAQTPAYSEEEFIRMFNEAVANKDVDKINAILSGQLVPGTQLYSATPATDTTLITPGGFSTNTGTTGTNTTSATSKTPTREEVIDFGATQTTTGTKTTGNTAQTGAIPDTFVTLGDIVTFSLKTYVDPTTPIEVYTMVYDKADSPIKKVFLKTVYNEETGVTKKYKLPMNEALLAKLVQGNANYIRIGYCLNTCKPGRNRLLPAKIILPRKLQPSSNNSTI